MLKPIKIVIVGNGFGGIYTLKNLHKFFCGKKDVVENKELKPFVYKHRGSLISLGQWMAIGEIANFTFSGHFAWWLWRTVYLSKLISFRKKMKVMLDWTVNLFSPRDISEI
ncbi:MAG: hypothetical protein AAB945_00150 [Patescibacteria group bacterium]